MASRSGAIALQSHTGQEATQEWSMVTECTIALPLKAAFADYFTSLCCG
ncbi:hypothetical protein GZA70_003928 [Salmonella enterica]|nr:hypothetical protein [Salmonella enterica]EGW4301427.1 hypothetical protein [Salmonella enterica subsp. enterica serovar Enteritidis]